MTTPKPGLRDQTSIRNGARVGGVICTLLGLVLVIIGFASFVSSMNNAASFSNTSSGPTIWPFFVGAPLLVIGTLLLRVGFIGAGVRYLAGEVAPTARQTMGFLGVGAASDACPHCGAANPGGAAFCEHCGGALNQVCTVCQRANDAGARYCAGCGKPLG